MEEAGLTGEGGRGKRGERGLSYTCLPLYIHGAAAYRVKGVCVFVIDRDPFTQTPCKFGSKIDERLAALYIHTGIFFLLRR